MVLSSTVKADSTSEYMNHSVEVGSGLDVDLLLYRIFDEYLLLISESGRMTAQIDQFLAQLKAPTSDSPQTTTRLAIFRAPRKHVILCCPECGVAETVGNHPEAWFVFRRFLMHLILNAGGLRFPVHACCVANEEGHAALISGLSGAGKTSVTAAVLLHGYRYAVDDYSLLQKDGSVLALPIGSTVSQNTFNLVPELEPLKSPSTQISTMGSGVWTVNFSEMFPVVKAFEPLKPTHFFFVTPGFGGRSSITPCSKEESLWHFQTARLADRRMVKPLRQTTAAEYELGTALAQKFVREARFFKVINGDLRHTAELIAEAFES